jgi:hypothetical protein
MASNTNTRKAKRKILDSEGIESAHIEPPKKKAKKSKSNNNGGIKFIDVNDKDTRIQALEAELALLKSNNASAPPKNTKLDHEEVNRAVSTLYKNADVQTYLRARFREQPVAKKTNNDDIAKAILGDSTLCTYRSWNCTQVAAKLASKISQFFCQQRTATHRRLTSAITKYNGWKEDEIDPSKVHPNDLFTLTYLGPLDSNYRPSEPMLKFCARQVKDILLERMCCPCI